MAIVQRKKNDDMFQKILSGMYAHDPLKDTFRGSLPDKVYVVNNLSI